MHYLIDGHNLIAKTPDISLDDPNDEMELILRLKSWSAGSRKRRVTVYFDGGLPAGVSHRLSTSDIKVIFARQGRTADSLLIRRIRKAQNPPEYTLVSSDSQIIRAAEAKKMPVLRSEEFVTKIGWEQRDAPPPPPDEREDPKLSEEEVAEWMELFGPPPERPSSPPKKRKRKQKPKRKRPSRRRSADELKSAADKLNEDEVAEWLELFSDDDD